MKGLLPFIALISFVFFIHESTSMAQGAKRMNSIPEGASWKAMTEALPLGAETWWLSRIAQEKHRDHERKIMMGNLPEREEASNFGGYINLLTQDMVIEVDPETGYLEESIEIRIASNEDNLDKVPLSFPTTFKIENVRDGNDVPIEWQDSTNTMILSLETPLMLGEELIIRFEAQGTLQCGGGGIQPCAFGGSHSYATHADYYVQGSPITLDLFSGSMEIRVPPGLSVAATGRLDEAYYGDEYTSFRYVHDFETIYYSFAIAEYVMTEKEIADVPVRIHTLQNVSAYHDKMLLEAENIIDFYTKSFSPFPFNNLDIVQMDNNFGGGYGPQATIMMYADVFNTDGGGGWGGGDSSRIQLMSHEIAHQWWGNFVNLASVHSVILSEGLAEFSSAYHWAEEYDSRTNFISNGMNYLYTVPEEEDVPLSSSYIFQSPHYNVLAYDKASVVFDMLRDELGTQVYLEGIAAYIDSYGYSAADLSKFFEVMENVSERDLSTFRKQWVDGTRYPTLQVETNSFKGGDNEWIIQVKVVQEESEEPFSFTLPMSVTFEENHRRMKLKPIQIEGALTEMEYRFNQPVLRINPDPDRTYLTRLFGSDPRDPNLSGTSDGTDLLDMAIMMHRNILFSWGNNQYFYPNPSYLDRYDLDRNGSINDEDLSLFIEGPQEELEEELEEELPDSEDGTN